MPKAYSYLRFSTPEQARGDSYRRQAELARAYAEAHGLELDERSYEDLGVSAFRGRNASTGALRAFRDAVESGDIEPGSYLLIESLDRLTRAVILDAQSLFLGILAQDVTIVTLSDRREYSRGSINANPTELLVSILIMMRSNEESQTKASRLRAAWQAKRRGAAQKPLTSLCPAWITLDRDTGAFRLKEDHAAIVSRIYAAAAAGQGKHKITHDLNAEGIPTFGRAKQWHPSYVQKILQNPAVIGTLVPHELDHQDGKRRRRPLDPVPNYFPPAVDAETFASVQSIRQGAAAPLRGRHASGEVRNVLGGLGRCALCGSSLNRVNKGRRGGKPYLVCSKARTGAGCTYHAVDYGAVEREVFALRPVLIADCPTTDEAGSEVDRELYEGEQELDALREAAERLVDELAAGRASRALRARLTEVEAKIAALSERRKALIEQKTANTPRAIKRRIELLDEAMQARNVASTNALLRQLVSAVRLDWQNEVLTFDWKPRGELPITVMLDRNPWAG